MSLFVHSICFVSLRKLCNPIKVTFRRAWLSFSNRASINTTPVWLETEWPEHLFSFQVVKRTIRSTWSSATTLRKTPLSSGSLNSFKPRPLLTTSCFLFKTRPLSYQPYQGLTSHPGFSIPELEEPTQLSCMLNFFQKTFTTWGSFLLPTVWKSLKTSPNGAARQFTKFKDFLNTCFVWKQLNTGRRIFNYFIRNCGKVED